MRASRCEACVMQSASGMPKVATLALAALFVLFIVAGCEPSPIPADVRGPIGCVGECHLKEFCPRNVQNLHCTCENPFGHYIWVCMDLPTFDLSGSVNDSSQPAPNLNFDDAGTAD